MNARPPLARTTATIAQEDVPRAEGRLGWLSGAGLVVANMVGAGVLLSTGFMAQILAPGAILGAWALGAALALLGAASYAAIAAVNGRSGGEYRYLSDYLHPSLGYLAGWGSLLLGFAAPVAVDALAVAAFVRVLVPLPVTATAAACIVAITLLHAFDLDASRRAQNVLVAVKLALIVGLIATGALLGSTSLPDWVPPEAPEARRGDHHPAVPVRDERHDLRRAARLRGDGRGRLSAALLPRARGPTPALVRPAAGNDRARVRPDARHPRGGGERIERAHPLLRPHRTLRAALARERRRRAAAAARGRRCSRPSRRPSTPAATPGSSTSA